MRTAYSVPLSAWRVPLSNPKDDDDASTHEIVGVLKEIIASEDKRKPLSDEALTSQIASRGYDIARRTVAKYREKLGIPVARLRKEI